MSNRGRPKKGKSPWVTTQVAASKLGVSPRHLLRLREDKTLICGKHWRDISRFGSIRPTYRWHLARCEKDLGVDS